MAQVADALVQEAVKSGLFFYADSNLKFDQAQAYLDVDRDKAAALGVSMAQIGADLGSLLGGNYVNFFNIQGRSYKVIPQVERIFRLNPNSLAATTSAPERARSCRCRRWHRCATRRSRRR